MTKLRVAIFGGGPVGVEAAASAAARGYSVRVYEAEEPGAHIKRWDHVRFFSPWELNRSAQGEELLKERGVNLSPAHEYPSGRQYREEYLNPLVDALRAQGVELRTNTTVLGVARRGALKGELLGGGQRGGMPFLIEVRGPEGERFEEADLVIDATGVLGQPNWMGPGGLPALGERDFGGAIFRQIPDVDGVDRERLIGKRVLVVGAGHSALTTLDGLVKLRGEDPETSVFWAYREEGEPCVEIEGDPLPERARLSFLGNAAARGELEGVQPLSGAQVVGVQRRGDEISVRFKRLDGSGGSLLVDQVVANVGYRPDLSLYQELQVHLCYASDGPMKLAASLLAQGGDAADCLAGESGGPEVLVNPEPNFFVLGAKSYGRSPQFLLKIGFEQIQSVMALVGQSL